MLDRISAVAASATFITVGTLVFPGVVPVNSFSLSSEDISHEQLHSSLFASDRFNFSLPTIADLGEPNTYFCYSFFNWCYAD
jgi:hypothetical protein